MMGGGELKQQSSSVMQQQMMWSGTADSKNMMSSLTMPCADQEQGASTSKMPPLSSSMLLQVPSSTTGLLDPREVVNGTAASLASSDLHDGHESSMPESWMSQLLLIEGLVGDHERYSVATTALLSKGLQEEGPVPHAAAAYNFYGGHGGEEIRTNKSQAAVSQMLLASSPRSCITTSLGSNMLDFSNSAAAPAPELRNHQSDNSSESNSNATGSAPKKARVQTSSSAQSTLKVRKERLGDRITALHQIVSPFGKTDTASVLQETIGYIRFLLSQIEALSYPYLSHAAGAGNGDDSILQHQQTLLLTINHSATTGGGNGTVDAAEQQDDAGNGNKEDLLRSRGLCLVPVSCASHLLADDDDDNAAGAGAASDFWAAPPPPPLGGIIWR